MTQKPNRKNRVKAKSPPQQRQHLRLQDRRVETVVNVERAIESAKTGRGKPWPVGGAPVPTCERED